MFAASHGSQLAPINKSVLFFCFSPWCGSLTIAPCTVCACAFTTFLSSPTALSYIATLIFCCTSGSLRSNHLCDYYCFASTTQDVLLLQCYHVTNTAVPIAAVCARVLHHVVLVAIAATMLVEEDRRNGAGRQVGGAERGDGKKVPEAAGDACHLTL